MTWTFRTPDEEYAGIADRQRSFIEGLAEKVEASRKLTHLEREWVAGILRAFANQLPSQPKRKRGQAPKIDAGSVAGEFAILRAQGVAVSHALCRLAEKHGVSEESIKKANKKFGEQAQALFGRPGSLLPQEGTSADEITHRSRRPSRNQRKK